MNLLPWIISDENSLMRNVGNFLIVNVANNSTDLEFFIFTDSSTLEVEKKRDIMRGEDLI